MISNNPRTELSLDDLALVCGCGGSGSGYTVVITGTNCSYTKTTDKSTGDTRVTVTCTQPVSVTQKP
jgi:hypothetical protein